MQPAHAFIMVSSNPEVETDIITLTRYILQSQTKVADASGDFTLLLNSLQFAFKHIAYNIRRSTLVNLLGLSGTANSTGDDQKKLDVIGDDIFINAMKASRKVRVVVSEEQEDLILLSEGEGRYAVVCDPIDGSSNLDAGVSVGTIFGIYRLLEGSKGSIKDVLRPGRELVCAGYTMYGASANLVLTTGHGVNGFTLDDSLGEFILTHPNMQLPHTRAIYSVNEGNTAYWSDGAKAYFESIKLPKDGSKPYSARYIGSMVADVHRTILYGGLFAYPADSKSKKGKLRLLYEGFPMAMIIEQAGGEAINDEGQRILDLVPEAIHERSGVWLGSKGEIEKARSFIAPNSK